MKTENQQTVKDYVSGRFRQTGWPFIPLVDIVNQFGKEQAKQELNDMYLAGMICKRMGGNGELVEYLVKD